jgi:hypothetical protein
MIYPNITEVSGRYVYSRDERLRDLLERAMEARWQKMGNEKSERRVEGKRPASE